MTLKDRLRNWFLWFLSGYDRPRSSIYKTDENNTIQLRPLVSPFEVNDE
jgi:hypothetical protein